MSAGCVESHGSLVNGMESCPPIFTDSNLQPLFIKSKKYSLVWRKVSDGQAQQKKQQNQNCRLLVNTDDQAWLTAFTEIVQQKVEVKGSF